MFGRKQIIAVLCIILSGFVHSGKSKDKGASNGEVNSFKAYFIGVWEWVMPSVHHRFKTIKSNTIPLNENAESCFIHSFNVTGICNGDMDKIEERDWLKRSQDFSNEYCFRYYTGLGFVLKQSTFSYELIKNTAVLLWKSAKSFFSTKSRAPPTFLKKQDGEIRVLPCETNLTPKEVTWMKTQIPFLHKTLVTLDVNTGDRSGPGYENGLYDITADYSLEIHTTKADDEGEYFCNIITDTNKTVSSDWTVKVLGPLTVPQKERNLLLRLLEGEMGILPCQINGDAREVTWMKHLAPSTIRTLVYLDLNVGKRGGPGYKEGKFNINEDYSLKINTVKADDEGEYRCKMQTNANENVSSEWIVTVHVIASDTNTYKDVVHAVMVIVLIILASDSIMALIESPKNFFLGRKSKYSDDAMTPVTESPNQPIHGMKFKYSDRISYYELWKLTKYASEFKEEDTLNKAVENLINASLTEDLYTSLRSWKEICDKCGGQMNQIEEIYTICTETGMKKSVQKLRDLRRIVSNVADSTSDELEHILWQVSKTSISNITGFLEELNIDSTSIKVASNSGLTEIVKEALGKLETWKEGSVPINPIVMLSLALENFERKESEDFFHVPKQKKQPVSQHEVEKCAFDVTIRHCNKIFEVIKSCGRGKGVLISQKQKENEKVLFDTCKMIKDWLDRQECSNYEKRRRLDAALGSAKSSAYSEHDEELFSAKVITQRVSGDKCKKVAVAYDLLMTDIKPFAEALDVEEGKLEKYRVQAREPEHLAKGTIGLVTLLLK